MKIWILAVIAIALLLFGFVWKTREGFDTLPDAKCADGSLIPIQTAVCADTGKQPTCPNGSSLRMVFKSGGSMAIKCVPNTLLYTGNFNLAQPTVNPCNGTADAVSILLLPPGTRPSRENTDHKGVRLGPPAAAATNDPSRTSGTTTGGTSGTTQGPNSGGGGDRRKQVFGPLFMGEGERGGVKGTDSSKTNKYPQLLGGDAGKASTRIEGGGIVNPSGVGVTLPSLNSLGLNENSGMFPFSRQPGDMELIPDPYRVSQQFSASSYSSKTEPVPFLTDFSAFQT